MLRSFWSSCASLVASGFLLCVYMYPVYIRPFAFAVKRFKKAPAFHQRARNPSRISADWLLGNVPFGAIDIMMAALFIKSWQFFKGDRLYKV